MRYLVPLLSIILLGSATAQVQIRDTTVSWLHFDYSIDSSTYSLSDFSSTNVVESEFDGIVLENSLVRLVILPGFGGRVLSFVYKPTGHEQFYQNPIGVPYQINSGIFYHDWLMVYGGLFPTFPEPEHGKYWITPWDFSVSEQSTDKITVSMWKKDELNNPVHPGQYNNGVTGITCYFDITLEAGKPYFDARIELTNDQGGDNYEYWTCITFAPGSEPGDTYTPANTEMVVPIEQYQVAWNPGNWMNSLDEVVQASGPRVQSYDRLAHLSNWEDMGIAYAYPAMVAAHYGVINHDNQEGLFRISSDQSQTPGMKFWTWGNENGLQADPSNFNEEARPYIELWSGTSHEFFEDAYLDAQTSISWTETYFPTVGIPDVSFINKDVAFHAELDEGTLFAYTFIPALNTPIDVQVTVVDGSETLWSERVIPVPDPIEPHIYSLDLASLNLLARPFQVQIELQSGNETIYSWEYANPAVLSLHSFDPPEMYLSAGQIQLQFSDQDNREIALYNLQGSMISREFGRNNHHSIAYPGKGTYIVRVITEGSTWSKKIMIR